MMATMLLSGEQHVCVQSGDVRAFAGQPEHYEGWSWGGWGGRWEVSGTRQSQTKNKSEKVTLEATT